MASAQDNLELLRVAFRQMMETGDPPYELVPDDFVWDMSGDETWVERAEYRGPDGMREFIRSWREVWEDWHMEIDEAIPVSDNIVVLVLHQSARVRGSAVPVQMNFAQVWIAEDGVVKRMIMCRDKESALERAREAVAASRTPTRD